jgi:SGNH domain (fused to AT3 domains)
MNSIICKIANRRSVRCMTSAFAVLAVVLAACSTSPSADTAPQGPKKRPSQLTGQSYATTEQVLAAVAAAQQTRVMSDAATAHLVALSKPHKDGAEDCFDRRETNVTTTDTTLGDCAYGDASGKKIMALMGDSRAPMWAATLERVAAISGWQVRVFAKGGCPPADLQYQNNETHAPDPGCDTFRSAALDAIQKLHPQLVVTASHAGHTLANGNMPTTSQWRDAWVSTFKTLAQPGTRVAILGSIPSWDNNDAQCLAAHTRDVQKCSTERANAVTPFFDAERDAAAAAGAQYVDTVPWVCAEKCEPVISDIVLYYDPYHFTKKYADYLSGAVAEALKPSMT